MWCRCPCIFAERALRQPYFIQDSTKKEAMSHDIASRLNLYLNLIL